MKRINAALADRPEERGESRARADRVLCSPPITVWFRVEDTGVAVVHHVRHARPRH